MASKVEKMRELTAPELRTALAELREQLFKLRWQAANGQAENPKKISAVRHQIARHLTILREREMAEKTGERA